MLLVGYASLGKAEQPPRKDSAVIKAGKAGTVVAGVTAVSCLLIPQIQKLCRRAIRSLFRSPDSLQRSGTSGAELSEIQRVRREIDQLKDDFQLLVDELKSTRISTDETLNSMLGRQANFNGFVFENGTAEALPRLLGELFPKLQLRRIVRNAEGHYLDGKNIRQLEFDTIAISDHHVFVIESKVGLKKGHVDKFVKKLDNFSLITFDDNSLNKQLFGKKVHGGVSYMFDGKWRDEDNLERAHLVSRYARDDKKLLTISRLNPVFSGKTNLAKLQDFNRAKVKRRTHRRREGN